MSFDLPIDRRGTGCSKWDRMEDLYGVSSEDGLAMWVADMDFRSPPCVNRAVRALADHGVYGYRAPDDAYLRSIVWWMRERHGWEVDPAHILTTHGLVNGIALLIDLLTGEGDGVAIMSPVYLEFGKTIRELDREAVELPLAVRDGRHALDLEAWHVMIGPRTRMLIVSSPHNPGGRVWTVDELRGLADLARRHDLVLVSDEIHHDLVFPGHTHVPMPVAAPGIADRLIVAASASKTFNIAGLRTGCLFIADDGLRRRVRHRLAGLSISPNLAGQVMTEAAYSPEGAAWVDDLVRYLDGNRQVFSAGLSAIPGVRPMPLDSTYLAWVDFAATGMPPAEFTRRVETDARIAASRGTTFGTGGETYLRFNIGTQRARVEEAVDRLQAAFADLQ
jgi:cystathionine beta-lyase